MIEGELDEPSRVSFSGLDWGRDALNAAWEQGRTEASAVLKRYGTEVGVQVLSARKFLERRGRVRLRMPPSGWSFVDAVRQAQLSDRSPGELLGETERHEWAGFWLWYLPLEAWTLELCELIRSFHRLGEAELLDGLCAVASDLRRQLMLHENDRRIPWLPQRLGWGPRGQREQMTIVGLLGKHLIEFDDALPEPPAWAQEELPMRSPFDE